MDAGRIEQLAKDRDALARYLLEHEASIRAVARKKLTTGTRSVYDSEDILSSVLRRVDTMAKEGSLRPRSEAELWALINTIAANNAINRTRLIERARNLLTEDGPYAYALLQRLNAFQTDDEVTLLVHRMLSCLRSGEDRQLLVMYLRGAALNVIADHLKISADACRQRWRTIRNTLHEHFESGVLDG